jgi:nicotinamide mononucleotide transporter
MTAFLFELALSVGGASITWLELLAFVLALAMVGLNLRENHWGWLMAILSSALYFFLFWHSRLYGDAALQLVFVLCATWGWWIWLHPAPTNSAGASASGPIRRLSPRGRLSALLASLLLWPLTGVFLWLYTDTDVPWWDAFPTAASLVGQWLLMHKYCENWLVWIVVNAVSVALFAYKGLWLTVLLYLIFMVLSCLGWRIWQARLQPPAP